MIHTITIDLAEATNFKSISEKRELIEHILCNMNSKDYIVTLKKILSDILEAEEEFDQRLDVINALKILVQKL